MKYAIGALMLTPAFCALASDNERMAAFARANAGKYIAEINDAAAVKQGELVTLAISADAAATQLLSFDYDGGTGMVKVTGSPAGQSDVKYVEKCKSAGSYIGQNAFGAKMRVQKEKCERYFINGTASYRNWLRIDTQIKATPDQFRVLKAKGASLEADVIVGNLKGLVAEFTTDHSDPTIDDPTDSDTRAWSLYGVIKEIRMVMPITGERVTITN